MALKLVPLIEYLASKADKKRVSFIADVGHRYKKGVRIGIIKRYYLLKRKTKGKTFYAKSGDGKIRRFFSISQVYVEV